MATVPTIPARALGSYDNAAVRRRSSLWSRLAKAVSTARMRAADREIARFIELNGGRITDSIERKIERRFL